MDVFATGLAGTVGLAFETEASCLLDKDDLSEVFGSPGLAVVALLTGSFVGLTLVTDLDAGFVGLLSVCLAAWESLI